MTNTIQKVGLAVAGLTISAALGPVSPAHAGGDTSFNTRQHQVRYVPADGGAFCIKERRGRYILPGTRYTGSWSDWHTVAYFAEPCWVLDPSGFTFP